MISCNTLLTYHAVKTGRCRWCTGSRAKRNCEVTLDHLTGYEGARPVRVGNTAYTQRQNDVYGAVLDSLYLHAREYGHNSQRLWPVIEDQVRRAIEVWREPEQGTWETRGAPKHYVSFEVDVLGRARSRGAIGGSPRTGRAR
jgi:hypothetical protein